MEKCPNCNKPFGAVVSVTNEQREVVRECLSCDHQWRDDPRVEAKFVDGILRID